MSVNINFSTDWLSREEATGLTAFLGAVQPSLLPAADIRAAAGSLYGSTALGGSYPIPTDAQSESPVEREGRMMEEVFASLAKNTPIARVPGQPAPGKTRRTKAEIAEDEALGGQQGIQTGGERADPENPDDAATEAQDKADEQAEVESERKSDAPLTGDDLKAAMGEYVAKFGLAVTKDDGVQFFNHALGTPPDGEAFWKVSLLGDDQEKLGKAIATWKRAVAENPLKRTAV